MSQRSNGARPRRLRLSYFGFSLAALALPRCDPPPPAGTSASATTAPVDAPAPAPAVTDAATVALDAARVEPPLPTPMIAPGVDAPASAAPRAPYAATGIVGGGALLAWSVSDAQGPGTSLVVSQSFDRAGAPLTRPQLVRTQRGTVRTLAAASASEREALLAWAANLRESTVVMGAQRVRLDGARISGTFSLGVFRLMPSLPVAQDPAVALTRSPAAAQGERPASPEPSPSARANADATSDALGLPLALAAGNEGRYLALFRGAQLPCPEGPLCRTLRAVSVEPGNRPRPLGGVDGVSLTGPIFVLASPADTQSWWGFAHDNRGVRRTEHAPTALDALRGTVGLAALFRHGGEAQALVRALSFDLVRVRLREGAPAPERFRELSIACAEGVPVVRFVGLTEAAQIPVTAQGGGDLLRLALIAAGYRTHVAAPDAVAWAGEALVAARGTELLRARCTGARLGPFTPVPAPPPPASPSSPSSSDAGTRTAFR